MPVNSAVSVFDVVCSIADSDISRDVVMASECPVTAVAAGG